MATKNIDVDANIQSILMADQSSESITATASSSSVVQFFLKNGIPFYKDHSGDYFPAAVEYAVFTPTASMSYNAGGSTTITWQLAFASNSGLFSVTSSNTVINMPSGVWLVFCTVPIYIGGFGGTLPHYTRLVSAAIRDVVFPTNINQDTAFLSGVYIIAGSTTLSTFQVVSSGGSGLMDGHASGDPVLIMIRIG